MLPYSCSMKRNEPTDITIVSTTAAKPIQKLVIAMLLMDVAPPFDSWAISIAKDPHMIDVYIQLHDAIAMMASTKAATSILRDLLLKELLLGL